MAWTHLFLFTVILTLTNAICNRDRPATRANVQQGSFSPPIPTLLTKFSTYLPEFDVPSPPTFSTRTDCPHLQQGLKDWHNPSTWPGGKVPQAGSSPVLPENAKILVSSCSWPTGGYHTVTVPASSELIFNDFEMTITVSNIRVAGALRMGSPKCRLFSEITVKFFGSPSNKEELGPGFGSKGIAVTGTIDIHGYLYNPTWTRLAKTAVVGENVIWLQDKVNWEVGQEIVVITSAPKDDGANHQNERVKVTGVSGQAVRFSPALKFAHYAGAEYQSEVILLSRRIQFLGDGKTGYGAHVIIKGDGRIQGVQGVQMGQFNKLGRYPFHFHMIGDCPTCLFSDLSIVESQFRCAVIHQTNKASILRSVAYEAKGSCFYLEDGNEEENQVMYNFAGRIHPCGRPSNGKGFDDQSGEQFSSNAECLQPADHSAGGFYFPNAYNIIVGNAASGGWAGFNFPKVDRVLTKPQSSLIPSKRPTLLFENNTAHSSGHLWVDHGSCIYVGGGLSQDSGDVSSAKYTSGRFKINGGGVNEREPELSQAGKTVRTWSVYRNIRTWLCGTGFAHWGNRAEIRGYEAHDCSKGAMLFGGSTLHNALINADSGNPQKPNFRSYTWGFQFYDTNTIIILHKVTFKNFNQKAYAVSSMTLGDTTKPQGISAVSNIKFINTPNANRLFHNPTPNKGSTRLFSIVDNDGSFSGLGVPSILGNFGQGNFWKYSDKCKPFLNLNQLWACPKDSDAVEVANLEFGRDRCDDGWGRTVCEEIGRLYLFGNGITQQDNLYQVVTKNPGNTGVTGAAGWYLHLNEGTPKTLRIGVFQMPIKRSVILAINYPPGTKFTILKGWSNGGDPPSERVTQESDWKKFLNGNGFTYFFDNTHLYLKVVRRVGPFAGEAVYKRYGVEMSLFQWGYNIQVTANCNGAKCISKKVWPLKTDVVPPLMGPIDDPNTQVLLPNSRIRSLAVSDSDTSVNSTPSSPSNVALTVALISVGTLALIALVVVAVVVVKSREYEKVESP